jgi:penicillin V acylase-like amidase (Ntn superfamily)
MERMQTRRFSRDLDGAEDRAALDEADAVGLFFRILGAVAPPDGAVLTESGASHRTLYACCMDGAVGKYHLLTEGDFALRTVGFEDGGEI